MININFLNENILFSTEKGRKQCINSINSFDKSINYFINKAEKMNKIIYNACNTFFNGDIIKNVNNSFSKLESINKSIDELYDDIKNMPDDINIFKKDIFTELNKRKKTSNKADFKKDEVTAKYQELANKCKPEGEYNKKLANLITSLSDIGEHIENDIKPKIMQSVVEFDPDTKEYKALRRFISESNSWLSIVKNLYKVIISIK